MPVDVSGTLRQALSKLEAEKARIERQIGGLRQALSAGAASLVTNSGLAPRARHKRGRKGMSPAQRKAVGARMKAYWAKRKRASGRKGAAKGK